MNSPPITKTYSSSPKANEILSDFSHSEEKNEEGNPNKENLDPFNKMITPLKQSKFQNYHNSSNRSPLQDITPTLGGKKTKETQVFFYKIKIFNIFPAFIEKIDIFREF